MVRTHGLGEVDRRSLVKAGGLIGVGALTAFSGCMGDDGDDDVDDVDDDELPEVEMTFGHFGPPDIATHNHRVAVSFQRYMERESNGKFTVDIAPAGELGGIPDVIEQISSGEVEAATGAETFHLSPFYADFNIAAMPFVYPNLSVANYVWDHGVGRKIRAGFREDMNIRILAMHDNGFRSFHSSDTLQSTDDFSGQRIRVIENEPMIELVEQLGASPEPVAWGELYEAFDTGLVDGGENALPTFMMGSFEEVQNYWYDTQHVIARQYMTASEEWLNDLHPAYEKMVHEAGLWASIDARALNRSTREWGFEYIQDEGMELTTLSADERDVLADQTLEPVEDVVRDSMDTPDLVDELYEDIDTALEELGF